MKTSVIIINWNRKHDVVNAVQSVLDCDAAEKVNVLIYDNASTDGSAGALRERFDHCQRVLVVNSPANDGVCLGRNKAAGMTNADVLVFMDSDSIVRTHDAFATVENYFQNNAEVGLLGFAIYNSNENLTWPFLRPVAEWGDRIFDCARCDGCGFAIRKSLYDQFGGFPEHFGYGAEDIYLARLCLNLGVSVRYFPKVKITHMASSSGRTADQFITMLRNQIWMPLELFRWPWSLISAARMTMNYFFDALHEKRLGNFFSGALAGWFGFNLRWRRPFTKENWKKFKQTILEDRRRGEERVS